MGASLTDPITCKRPTTGHTEIPNMDLIGHYDNSCPVEMTTLVWRAPSPTGKNHLKVGVP
jgi:hypothetical protein